MTTLGGLIANAVAIASFGTATAHRRGRDPRWPYVPVIVHDGGVALSATRQETITGKAFASRVAAVAYAEGVIETRRRRLAEALADPTKRSLREVHGLPREIDRHPNVEAICG